MTTETIQFKQQGYGRNRLFDVSYKGKSGSLVSFINQFTRNDVKLIVSNTNDGDIVIEPDPDEWAKYADIDRQASLIHTFVALVDAGVPEGYLNYRSARPTPNGWRPATLLYININEDPEFFGANKAGTPVKQDTDALLSTLGEQFIANGGDISLVPNVSTALQVAWLKAQLKSVTVEESTEPTDTPDEPEQDLDEDEAPL